MNQDQFVARRKPQWDRLEQILGQLQRQGVRRLPLPMVQEVGRLYRQTASDLAYARTYFPGSGTVRYLNHLVSQAHHMIYAEEPQRFKSLLNFFRQDVPRTIRKHYVAVVLATLLMVVGGLVGFFATLYDRNVAEALVSPDILERVVSPQERYDMAVNQRPAIGTIIMLNNIKVGATAFALGISLGLGTGLILFYNGLIVGVVVAHSLQSGHFASLWAHLLAHGALELMAIFLCGAAGLVLGWAIVAPGDLPRSAAVSQAAKQAVTMVMGSIPFFVIAAAIEGFVTPMLSLPDAGKFLVAIGTGSAGLAYWLFAGRTKAVPAP